MSKKNFPQIVYWRDRSAEAETLTASLAAEKWEAQFNLVETPEQFSQALEHPRIHLVISHAPSMTNEICKKVQSSCPDVMLVVVCDDETKLPEIVRDCANHVLNTRQLDQLPPLLRRALRRSSRFFSLKDERDDYLERAQLLDLIEEAVIVQRPDGIVSTWNKAASKLFGWTEEEAVGKPRTELLAVVNSAIETQIAALMQAHGDWLGEVGYRGKNKKETHVKARRSWIRGNAAHGTFEICSDRSAERLELLKTRLVTAAQNLLASSLPLQDRLEQFGRLVVPACADICALDLREDDVIRRSTFSTRYPELESLAAETRDDFPIFPSNRPTALDSLQRTEAEVVAPVNDLAVFLGITHAELQRELRKFSQASALTATVLSDGKPAGLLTFVLADRSRVFTESDKQRIAQFVHTIGAAIRVSQPLPPAVAQPLKANSERYYKDAFLGAISHELRTPLQAMFGWTQLMRDKKLTAVETENALDALEMSLNSQNKIVNDLLDLSRINAGKLELIPRPIQLKPLLENTLEAFHVSAGIKQIELQWKSIAEPIWVMADAEWLQRCLWRILSNSIKFTPLGGTVSVSLSADSTLAEMSIADTGIGIDAAFLPHVFDHFSQADTSTTRSYYGLGIGLAIARHIAEAHGGSIDVASEGLNKGATFTVRMPRCAATELAQETSLNPADDYQLDMSLNGVRILVVEDELDTRNLLCFVLEQAGAVVAEAASAKDGMAALAGANFDVLISDIGMPLEDGLSLIRKVRSLPPQRGGRIPALALTAYASKEDRVQALRAGYQMHVPKPVDIGEIVLIIRALLNQPNS